MSPFDIAWRVLKAPIHETDVPGVRFAEGSDPEVREARKEPGIMGYVPRMDWTPNHHGDEIREMTPNDYFDAISREYTDEVLPPREAEYRWPTGDGTNYSRENIARLQQGIEEGKVMGMPWLSYGNSGTWQKPVYDRFLAQEGGHRMEALRQMGHGDTPVPVAVRQKRDA